MRKRNNLRRFRRCLLSGAVLLLGIVCLLGIRKLVLQGELEHLAAGSVWSPILFLLLYAVKSATVFFPMLLLEIAAGHCFPAWEALVVNFLGVLITLTVPYWIGYSAGGDAVIRLRERYPRFAVLVEKQEESSFFLCFFLRAISCLPGDIVTMYLGASRTPFWKNVAAGTLAVVPGMVLAILMGSSIQNPQSPVFWLSALLTVVLSAGSGLLYFLYRRRLGKRNLSEDREGRQAP